MNDTVKGVLFFFMAAAALLFIAAILLGDKTISIKLALCAIVIVAFGCLLAVLARDEP